MFGIKKQKKEEDLTPEDARARKEMITEESSNQEKEETLKFGAKKETDQPTTVHTMPQKFHDGTGKGKKKDKKNRFMFVGIIVIVVLVLGVIAAFLFQRIIGPQANTNEQNLNTAVANANENTNQNLNQNGNQNENLNQNLNQNLNTNLNVNTNAPKNLNQNANLNANLNQNINLNVNAPLPSSKDSDRDGLTDKEEEVFGTEINKPDSDNDSYSDGVEISAGYDPLGSGRLVGSTSVLIYTNQSYHYSLLYPQGWLAQATASNNKEVLFTADTAEFVEALVTDNPSSLTVEEWFLTQFPDLTVQDLTTITTWENQAGILSLEGNTVYLGTDDYIYLISYNTGTRTEANFRKTFEMIYHSFELVPESETNVNVNLNTNTNLNLNDNQNINSNANQNTNANLNSNLNQNSNLNTNTNTNGNSNSNSNSNSSSIP